jgi:gluconolactonase
MRMMSIGRWVACVALAGLPLLMPSDLGAQAPAAPPAPPANPMPIMPPQIPAAHVVNLMTEDGVRALGAQWKNMDVKIVEAPPREGAGPKWTSSYDIQPHAGVKGFDDSKWPAIEAKALADRIGGGRLFMTWYRTNLTIPAKIGDFDTSGAIAVLTFTIDDYAEAWVNGAMPRRAGRTSPATIQGFNIPNRVVLTEQAKAGDKFEIAILGINGPISLAPPNPVFFREARIEFYK